MRTNITMRAARGWFMAAALLMMAGACDADPAGPGTPAEPAPVASVQVTPKNGVWAGTMAVGYTIELAVTPLAADGTELPVTSVQWATSDTAVAAVTPAGLLQAKSAGSTEVIAVVGGKVGRLLVVVVENGPGAVASVQIAPAAAVISAGQTLQYAARALAADGSELTDRAVSWSVTPGSIVSITQNGLLTALAPGYADVTASIEGVSATVGLTVTGPALPPVVRVEVVPMALVLPIGETRQYVAHVFGADGQQLTGRNVTWSITSNGVASITATGLVSALAPGYASVTATVDGISGSVGLTVPTPEPVAHVIVMPGETAVFKGLRVQLTAHTLVSGGGEVSGRTVTWASETPEIAQVGADGLVLGIAKGTARIRAMSEGKVGYATVEVRELSADPVQTYTLDGVAEWRSAGIEIGQTTWQDSTGTERAALMIVSGGTLRLDLAAGTWTQTFVVETYLSGATSPQPPVAVDNVTDHGQLFWDFVRGMPVMRSSVTPGLELTAQGWGAGEYMIPQSVRATMARRWVWVME